MKRILRRMIMPVGEVRMDGETGKICGYAAVFDTPTELWPGFREVIRPGAFSKTLREADVRALFNHDPNLVLGRNTSGTLKLWEDARGLVYEIDPPNTELGRSLVESLRRGDISQSSFGFWVIKERRLEDAAAGVITRELLEVELQDVSPVTFPAYEETQAMVRSAREEIESNTPPDPKGVTQSNVSPDPTGPDGTRLSGTLHGEGEDRGATPAQLKDQLNENISSIADNERRCEMRLLRAELGLTGRSVLTQVMQ
jgi:hypothetical protein